MCVVRCRGKCELPSAKPVVPARAVSCVGG